MIGATELHTYTATVQRGAVGASSSPYHPGGTGISFTTPAASTSVACRLQRLDTLTLSRMGEMIGGGKAGTVVMTHHMYIAYSAAPSTLLAQSSPSAESLHRVVNVYGPDGALLDAGPFEILKIIDLAGAQDVLKLELRRVQ